MGAKLEQVPLLYPAPASPSRSHPSAFQSDVIFQDLEKLKSRPAHLGVFLRYIFSQADPSPLVSQECQAPAGPVQGTGEPGEEVELQ